MKQGSPWFLSFLFAALLFFHSTTSARLLPPNQDDHKAQANGISQAGSYLRAEEDDISNLLGLEKCIDKDEDCLKRRMVAEAHLDYIYTQHKPKP
ncbi:unnamed protein product [Ilex paraguariensis]|uniref:Phytosulfokine n=1 Tax=Ilex paraguariensis TaxID=185542 RepID=A0ABC8TFE2_9AQUA